MSTNSPADGLPQIALSPISLGWFLKRTAIGIAILTVAISAMAWLTYASIDPQLDAQTIEGELVPDVPVTKVKLAL
jgi:hypothetical protein